MNKFQFVIRASAEEGRQSFKQKILQDIIPAILKCNPVGLKLGLSDPQLPGLTVLPLRKDNLALISCWSETSSDVVKSLQSVLSPEMTLQGYLVEESTPVLYEKTWPDGEISPGIVLLTLLKQNQRLSYEAFMHEWHGRHTPKAMRIHPFWNYIRNVIKEAVIEDSPNFDGIVEEHFRTRSDCINPVRMFGGLTKFIPNMVEVGLHAKHFLDLKQTENYLLTEIHFRSLN